MLPGPVTSYSTEAKRRVVLIDSYKYRILEDPNMASTENLIKYGDKVFNDTSEIIDLTDIDNIKESPSVFESLKYFVPMNDTATDFYLKAKPHNGPMGLRKGFYRLIPNTEYIPILDFHVWQMIVLYNEGVANGKIFKYRCNVGTLVNKFAVCRDLMHKHFINLPIDIDRRRVFLNDLVKKTIYVSSAEMVHVSDGLMKFDTKEVLWFQW